MKEKYTMSKIRRDAKGRVLRKGEDEMPDGRYRFRYTDHMGIRHAVYSWRLTAADKVPANIKYCAPLREKEPQILRKLADDQTALSLCTTTLNQSFERYYQNRKGLKSSTRQNYIYLYDRFIREDLGTKKISDIQYADIRKAYCRLLDEKNVSLGTLKILHTGINTVFKSAVINHEIESNPAGQVMSDLHREYHTSPQKKRALTTEEQNVLLDFMETNIDYISWKPLFEFLLMTGCRIGEALALTWDDYDPSKKILYIRRTLSYRKSEDGHYSIETGTPKTEAGNRIIPVCDRLALLLSEFQTQGGQSAYIFHTKTGCRILPSAVNRILRVIVANYNSSDYRYERNLLELPNISSHIFRHTFCRKLCEADVNMKVIQTIMGHSDIRITMNVYAEVSEQKLTESLLAIQDKLTL